MFDKPTYRRFLLIFTHSGADLRHIAKLQKSPQKLRLQEGEDEPADNCADAVGGCTRKQHDDIDDHHRRRDLETRIFFC